jgi:hypothetical protein
LTADDSDERRWKKIESISAFHGVSPYKLASTEDVDKGGAIVHDDQEGRAMKLEGSPFVY